MLVAVTIQPQINLPCYSRNDDALTLIRFMLRERFIRRWVCGERARTIPWLYRRIGGFCVWFLCGRQLASLTNPRPRVCKYSRPGIFRVLSSGFKYTRNYFHLDSSAQNLISHAFECMKLILSDSELISSDLKLFSSDLKIIPSMTKKFHVTQK